MKKLSETEIHEQLSKLPQWKLAGNKIKREYKFKDFVECFSFMQKVALICEKADHHPNWSNVYNTLLIEFTTHDADPQNGGALTEKDFDLASQL